jgi:hypothetical protein
MSGCVCKISVPSRESLAEPVQGEEGGEGQVGDGEPLMPNLKLLINFTESSISSTGISSGTHNFSSLALCYSAITGHQKRPPD